MRAIEDVIETYEKEAKVLRRHGSAALAESIEQMVHQPLTPQAKLVVAA